ncbi:hypothetical protein [Pseudoclavibacter sp. RFBA6]|uniref:hypothetical protein n=1 Tax=Pseudoclavibacter sp. RFBA6 TaxID=2080573 RepID=UPI000CE8EDEF|nr:hypothetical protein [Pseudoclavibacter sp. RFBA6]PPG38147.1 hypothetical protein C5C17_16000 [Pseudoclavibacter sp. RFBA6]
MHALNAFLTQLLRSSGEAQRSAMAPRPFTDPTPSGWIALPWEGLQFSGAPESAASSGTGQGVAEAADEYLRSLTTSESRTD